MGKNIILFILLSIISILSGCGRKALDISTGSGSMEADSVTEEQNEFEYMESSLGEQSEKNESESSEVCVYVCGAVQCEGVYYLPVGSIKMDALTAAGGYSEDAFKGYVNLAEALQDGEKIYFPYQDETENIDEIPYGTGADSMHESAASGLVNLNTATKEELMTLPGIGESKALAIIRYREDHQGFQNTEEIMNINGIKEGVYNNIKDLITV